MFIKYLSLLVLAIVLAGCSATSVPTAPSAVGIQQNGKGSYPVPANQAYPAAKATTYPPPRPTPCSGPKFTINSPLHKGDTTLSGTGPVNATIQVVDVTRQGAALGTATIGADGTFKATLSSGLRGGDRIGLMGAGADRQRFLCGPGYQDLPTVGIVFATEQTGQ